MTSPGDSDLEESNSVPPVSPPPNLKIFTPTPHHLNSHPPLPCPYLPPSPPPSSPAPNDPPQRFPRDSYGSPPMNDISLGVSLDDENLSSVERIYLLCISKETVHRSFFLSSFPPIIFLISFPLTCSFIHIFIEFLLLVLFIHSFLTLLL